MALETATHISDLDEDNPDQLDYGSTLGNHVRMLKDVLLRDIPFTEAVTSTAAELNLLDGKTSLLDPNSTSEQTIAGNFTVAKASGDSIIQAHAPSGSAAILKGTINSLGVYQWYADATYTYLGHYDSAGDWLTTSVQIPHGDASGDLVWSFTNIPLLPASDPTTANQATRKSYVDSYVDAEVTKAKAGGSYALRTWESSEQTYPASPGTYSTITGPGYGEPIMWQAVARCVSAEYGYSSGDELPLPHFMGTNSGNALGVYVKCNSTGNFQVKAGADGSYERILNFTDGGIDEITPTNWRIVIRGIWPAA